MHDRLLLPHVAWAGERARDSTGGGAHRSEEDSHAQDEGPNFTIRSLPARRVLAEEVPRCGLCQGWPDVCIPAHGPPPDAQLHPGPQSTPSQASSHLRKLRQPLANQEGPDQGVPVAEGQDFLIFKEGSDKHIIISLEV